MSTPTPVIAAHLGDLRLIQFFDKNKVLYQNQFGFRQGHSTYHAIITLVDNITKSLDKGYIIVIGVFLDLKKGI